LAARTVPHSASASKEYAMLLQGRLWQGYRYRRGASSRRARCLMSIASEQPRPLAWSSMHAATLLPAAARARAAATARAVITLPGGFLRMQPRNRFPQKKTPPRACRPRGWILIAEQRQAAPSMGLTCHSTCVSGEMGRKKKSPAFGCMSFGRVSSLPQTPRGTAAR
jgi:hypothetical protein